MNQPLSERRMAENEMVFREYNERIKKGFDELKSIAKDERQKEYMGDDDTSLMFYCECSDESCRKRVELKPSRYDKIHKHRNYFVIVRGHEVKSIERVIEDNAAFCIVEKFIALPDSTKSLNKTKLDNT